jgi:hypothetical protein
MLIVDQIDQGIGKTKLCIGIAPLGRNPRAADQRIIGAEDQRHGIEKKNAFIGIFHTGEIRDFPSKGTDRPALIFLVFCFGFGLNL